MNKVIDLNFILIAIIGAVSGFLLSFLDCPITRNNILNFIIRS